MVTAVSLAFSLVKRVEWLYQKPSQNPPRLAAWDERMCCLGLKGGEITKNRSLMGIVDKTGKYAPRDRDAGYRCRRPGKKSNLGMQEDTTCGQSGRILMPRKETELHLARNKEAMLTQRNPGQGNTKCNGILNQPLSWLHNWYGVSNEHSSLWISCSSHP